MVQRLSRIGGYLVAPRGTLRRVPAGAFRGDGAWLVAAYLAGAWAVPLSEQLARAFVTRDLSSMALLAAAVARAVLVPVLVSVVAEGVFGRRGTDLRGIALAPLVLVTVVLHGVAAAGWGTWPRPYLPELAGAVAALAYVAWARPAAREAPVAETGASPRRGGALAAGLALSLVTLWAAAVDGTRVVRGLSQMRLLGPGANLPALDLSYDDGRSFATGALADGRPTVLVFWATWCGVCRSEMPMYEEVARAVEPRGGRVVTVLEAGGGPGARKQAAAARRALGVTLPIVIDDGRLYRAVGGRVLPHVVVLDGDGRLVAVHEGRVFRRTLLADLAEAGLAPAS